MYFVIFSRIPPLAVHSYACGRNPQKSSQNPTSGTIDRGLELCVFNRGSAINTSPEFSFEFLQSLRNGIRIANTIHLSVAKMLCSVFNEHLKITDVQYMALCLYTHLLMRVWLFGFAVAEPFLFLLSIHPNIYYRPIYYRSIKRTEQKVCSVLAFYRFSILFAFSRFLFVFLDFSAPRSVLLRFFRGGRICRFTLTLCSV